jgi:tetratricopeptide (TPR) repeat protein
MYDIKPLEEEWDKYRKKKMKPWYILIFSFLFIFLFILLFFNYKDLILSRLSILDNNTSISVAKPIKTVLLLDNALMTLEVNNKIIKKKINKSKSIVKTDISSAVDDPMKYHYPNAKKVAIDVSEPIKKPAVIERPKKKMHLNIIQTSSRSAYRDVEKRFSDTKDVEDSLFLARTYYNKGNNKKAIFWALQTNKINNNIEESWIIFAKAKARSGHKDEAIRILSSYVKRSNSFEAKALLRKYKK